MNYKWEKRTIETDNGMEMVVEKKYNLFKDQWQNRLWVFQPQDPKFKALDDLFSERGIW